MLIDKLIRSAIGTALTGNVLNGANTVKVYNKVPDGALMPYIEIIGQSTRTEGGDKDDRGFNTNVPIRILTKAVNGLGGDEEVDDIEQQVIDLIDGVISISGYRIINTEYTSQSFTQQFGSEFQTHKILNFFYQILKN